MCEFKGNSRVPGGWDNGVRHSYDVLQVLSTSRTINTRTFMGSSKAFTPVITSMSSQIHADFLRILWVLTNKQMRLYYEIMDKEDKI